jgi:predicted nucleic acid-binding protein
VAELAHEVFRANSPERSQQRRQFLDELEAQVPVQPVTEATAEIIARIGGEQAAKGINLPLGWNSATRSERAMSVTLTASLALRSCNSER